VVLINLAAMIRLTCGGPLHLGVNYRLSYGWDFIDGPLNVAAPARAAMLDSDFSLLASHGATLIRWFLWNDGRRIVVDGKIRRPDFDALRAGLDTAERHGLSVLLVLLDHTFCFREEPAGNAVKQGHGAWLKDDARFDRLLGELLEPTIITAGRHPAVMGFELINEPEMAMRRRDRWFRRATGTGCSLVPEEWQLTLAEMHRRMRRCADVVHRRTSKQFSVGSMSSRWLAQWEPCVDPAVDFLTFHYYGQSDEQDLDRVFTTRIAPVAASFPVGLGEFYPQGAAVVPPSRQSSPWPDHRLTDFFTAAARHRLQTALPWVWNPGTQDPGEIPLDEWARYRGPA
jgi:hypothetical protein